MKPPAKTIIVFTLVFLFATTPLTFVFAVAPTAYTYDKAGNMTSDGVNTYIYDAQNQLTKSIAGDTTTYYTYDSQG